MRAIAPDSGEETCMTKEAGGVACFKEACVLCGENVWYTPPILWKSTVWNFEQINVAY